MKKIFLYFFTFSALTFFSCSSDTDIVSGETPMLKTQISYEKFNSTKLKLESLFDSVEVGSVAPKQTRTANPNLSFFNDGELSEVRMEEKVQETLGVLVPDGVAIRDEILGYVYDGYLNFSESEVSIIENLNDESLAGLAFIVSYCSFEKNVESSSAPTFLHCFFDGGAGGNLVTWGGVRSAGYGVLSKAGSMPVVGVGRIALGMGLKALGGIGMAFAIAQALKCANPPKVGGGGCRYPIYDFPLKDYKISRLELMKMVDRYNKLNPNKTLTDKEAIDMINDGILSIIGGEICNSARLQFSDKFIFMGDIEPVN